MKGWGVCFATQNKQHGASSEVKGCGSHSLEGDKHSNKLETSFLRILAKLKMPEQALDFFFVSHARKASLF